MKGYPSFFASLLHIALLTALIGDLASFFGCVIDLSDHITAITIVALGTSMPDTFASLAAAKQDTYADASIGNITGSNSVNVFLGIGLPWGVAAVFWHFKGRTKEWEEKCCLKKPELLQTYEKGFIVEAGNLYVTIVAFLVGAITAFALFYWRRIYMKGELGGPLGGRIVSCLALVLLWVAYLAVSIGV